jgi:hypothetical protein
VGDAVREDELTEAELSNEPSARNPTLSIIGFVGVVVLGGISVTSFYDWRLNEDMIIHLEIAVMAALLAVSLFLISADSFKEWLFDDYSRRKELRRSREVSDRLGRGPDARRFLDLERQREEKEKDSGRRRRTRDLILLWSAIPILVLIPWTIVHIVPWLVELNDKEFLPDRFIVFQIVLLFVAFLCFFHFIAWLIRRRMTSTLVRTIDYLYLGTAFAGLMIGWLRQNVDQSLYVSLFSWPVTFSLVAALALRITKTTIEVFKWHQ